MKRTTKKGSPDRIFGPDARGASRRGYTVNLADHFFSTNVDKKSRTLYIGTLNFSSEGEDLGIEPLIAEYFIKGIHLLNQHGNQPITVLLNSCGGDTMNGFAIYDAIACSESPVDIRVFGEASSMGAVIMQAGRSRLLHPNVVVLVHDGYMQDRERKTIRSNEAWAAWNKKDRARMYGIFAERSGRPEKFWEEQCAHDSIYMAKKAVELGLADGIIPYSGWRAQLSSQDRKAHNGNGNGKARI